MSKICLGNISASMFANDTNITVTGQTVQELQTNLNKNLEIVHHWFLANKLTLSYNKTEYMIIGSRQKILNIQEEPLVSIGNETIKKISKCKTLGIITDDKLLKNAHSSELASVRRLQPIIGFNHRSYRSSLPIVQCQ